MPISHRHLHRRDDGFGDEGFHGKHVRDPVAVVKTVYKTMKPTFQGEIAGYTTVKKTAEKTTKAAAAKEEATTKAKAAAATTEAAKKVKATTSAKKAEATSAAEESSSKKGSGSNAKKTTSVSTVPTAIRAPAETSVSETVLAQATNDSTFSKSVASASAGDATSSALLSASATTEADSTSSSSSSSGGSSAGTKAGIAFGVLGGLFVVGLLVWLAFSRRRKQARQEEMVRDDEKLRGPIDSGLSGGVMASESMDTMDTMSVRTDPVAPRISLRPVTQFLPNWNLEKRNSKGAAMALSTPAAGTAMATTARAPGGSAWDRPSTSQSVDPSNPFGHQAERVPSPITEESIRSQPTMPPSPVSDRSYEDPFAGDVSPVIATAVTGAAVGSASLARKTSMRKNGPSNLDLTLPNPPLGAIPPSPAGTEFSVSSMPAGAPVPQSAGAEAIAAAGGPANSAVHRVQLDFKPTLEDELELRAGELVRLLHEFDDGWALCIRLDRSRQGVVPRTCLSTRPVKPRPAQQGPRPGPPIKGAGPPRGPGYPQGQRPMTPQGPPPTGRPMTPNGRPQSPMGRPMSPAGRPGGARPMSPGPRSQSPAGPRQGPPRAMSPGPRSMSPGPRSQSPAGPRPQSPNGMNRRNSPPGPSPMNPAQGPRPGPPTGSVNRKPVPGQAY